jgi:excisionase family DNA binding protein
MNSHDLLSRLDSIEQKIEKLIASKETKGTKDEILTIEQASDRYQIPVSTFRQYIRERKIGCSKPGKRIFLIASEVESFLCSAKRLSRKEIETIANKRLSGHV